MTPASSENRNIHDKRGSGHRRNTPLCAAVRFLGTGRGHRRRCLGGGGWMRRRARFSGATAAAVALTPELAVGAAASGTASYYVEKAAYRVCTGHTSPGQDSAGQQQSHTEYAP
jgi:hypothetical protein